jgi:ABC-type uncharacterized transport system involved in gliding motility auxiliary subunit
MDKASRSGRAIKLLLYVAAIILINIAGITLFFRWDLTRNKMFSLSPPSQQAISKLAEPLTIKVFFTKNLPAPHNGTEQYLHDLMQAYATYGNRYFNYQFFDLSDEALSGLEAGADARQQAEAYGINPVQIQAIEADEVKFQQAYMGLVIVQGDMIERIPAITDTDGLEYRITTAIQKLNNKISAFLVLEENIHIELLLSSSLKPVAPLMQLDQLDKLPELARQTVDDLNQRYFQRLEFASLDPTTRPELMEVAKTHHLLDLQWQASAEHDLEAGSGVAGMLVRYGEKSVAIPVIQVLQLPLIGNHYEMIDTERLTAYIEQALEDVIEINASLGYLADHGTLSATPPGPMAPPNQSTINAFRELVSNTYSINDIRLGEQPIPDGLNTLVIARPTEAFSDYELFQIDQHLMRGNNLILFLDRFEEVSAAAQQGMMGAQTAHVPIDTGLERLLAHWGVELAGGYVLDESSFKQRVPPEMGGGERAIYFAPLIKSENINNKHAFLEEIKGLVTLKVSPIHIDQEQLEKAGGRASWLITSSDASWLMEQPINLNPMLMSPPPQGEERQSFDLAYLLEGEFVSYFADKELPLRVVENEADQQPADTEGDADEAGDDGQQERAGGKSVQTPPPAPIKGRGTSIAKGQPAKIFIMSSAEMISDGILDAQGRSPNDMFVMNVIDALNGREEIAVMRSKQQQFNPLSEVSGGTKTAIKMINVIGPALVVIAFGLIVWWRRHARQREIHATYGQRGQGGGK